MSLRWKKDLEARWAAAGALKLGRGSAGLGYAGGAASASFLFLQTEIKGQKAQRDWRGLKLGRKLI